MSIAYIFNQDGSISGIVNSQSFTVQTSHPNYKDLKKAVLDRNTEEFLRHLNVVETVKTVSQGRITIENGVPLYNGKTIAHIITARMLEQLKDGYGIEPTVKFLERLYLNPSNNSVEQLCKFLENKCLPITEDGFFLAYKTVRNDYYDKYSQTILNKVGAKPSMPRNEVSDDPNTACGKGLHVGALHYAGPTGWYHNSGDRIMIVKVDPANVVSVPHDHSCGKMRTCGYEVVAEYAGELNKPVYLKEDELKTVEKTTEEDYSLYKEVNDRDDIWYGDELIFEYNGKARKLLVEDIENDLVSGTTEEGYRSFKFDKMSNIRYKN